MDLDKGTINVQLAPTPLPPRQRRKLIQSLEQYAPTSAIKRSAAVQNPALGPPVYVQEAFPHSRLTLFCGVSRAPRWNKRPLPAVPGGPGDRSTVHGDPRVASAANSSSISTASTSRDHGPLPNVPSYAGQVKKSSTLESLPLVMSEQQQQQQRLMMQNQDSRTSLTTVGGMVRSSSEDTLDQKSDAASRMSKVTYDAHVRNIVPERENPLARRLTFFTVYFILALDGAVRLNAGYVSSVSPCKNPPVMPQDFLCL